MFITGAEKESKWQKTWGFIKSYTMNVGHVYLEFLGPLVLLIAANMALDAQDKERFGLGWLYATSLKDDRVREEKFPPYEPTSAAQRRRNEAASAIEYVASAV